MHSSPQLKYRIEWIVNILTICLPVALLFYALARVIHTFSLEVTYGDTLYELQRIKKVFDGTLTAQDLWLQKGDHRSFFPRMLMYAMARLSHWNMVWDSWVVYFFAGGSFAVIFYRIHKLKAALGRFFYTLCVLWSAMLITSFAHVRLWAWSEGVVFSWCSFFALLGLSSLVTEKFNIKTFVTVFVCGVVSFYSFMTGLAYWPTVLIFFLLSPGLSRSQKINYSTLWSIASFVVIAFYFHNYNFRLSGASFAEYLWNDLRTFMQFMFLYLGGVWQGLSERLIRLPFFYRILVGLGCFIMHISFFMWYLQQNRQIRQKYIFFVLLIIYSYCGGFLFGLGRAYTREMNYPIYETLLIFSQPLWISLFVFLSTFARRLPLEKPCFKTAFIFCMIIIFQLTSIMQIQLDSMTGLKRIKRRKYFFFQYKDRYENFSSADMAAGIDRSINAVRYKAGLPILKEYKLAHYREK